jgi:Tol biopolymer transport system component
LSEADISFKEETLTIVTATTNKEGVVVFDSIAPGDHTIHLDKDEYVSQTHSVTVKRGRNSFRYGLTRRDMLAGIQVIAKDYVAEIPLSEVTVKLGNETVATDANGIALVSGIAEQEVELSLEKPGYHTITEKLILEKDAEVRLEKNYLLVPDQRLVYQSNQNAGKRGLFSINLDGIDSKPLTPRIGESEDFSPVMHPDWSKVAFLSTRAQRIPEGSDEFDPLLYVINVDGTDLVTVSEAFSIHSLQWNSSGTHLAWMGNGEHGNYETQNLYLYDLRSQTVTQLDGGASRPTQYMFNHAGTALVWTENNSGQWGLYYKDLETGEVRRISDGQSWNVHFSLDDAYVYYHQQDQNSEQVKYRIDAFSAEVQTIETKFPYTMIISPDGHQYAYLANRDGRSDLFVSDLQGGNEIKITDIGTASGSLLWHPSGEYIVFFSSNVGETALYITRTNGYLSTKKITDASYIYSYY